MNSIISVLVAYNQLLLTQIHHLLLFIAKNIPLKYPKLDFSSPKYKKLTVDALPVIKTLEKRDYWLLFKEYNSKHGKELKPVASRGEIIGLLLYCPNSQQYSLKYSRFS